MASRSVAAADILTVGSKRFTESYVLGEVVREAAERAGAAARHKSGLGNTGILYTALSAGAIDVYPEYTGTIARELLKLAGSPPIAVLNGRLAPMGLGIAAPLGFNNSYALAMRADVAAQRGIRTISDLARQPGLRFGLSQEFIVRADGWPGLARTYALTHVTPTGLDHGLAYEAIATGRIDVMDVYSTDAKIARYGLTVLVDDRDFFPRYEAVLLYRLDVPQRFPRAWPALLALEGRIDAPTMIRLNAAVEIEGKSFADVARGFFDSAATAPVAHTGLTAALFGADLARLTREHLVLVFVSLAAAVALGIPLGMVASKVPPAGQPILALCGVIQTVPALALLALLIAALDRIGTLPALVALFLYALLPIVRNTHAGMDGVRAELRQAAAALGLSARHRLLRVELPLALPTILAGVKTSAIINVGTATIAAFIGAGGYGERIVQGLALNDHTLLLAGALPAAGLALAVQGLFELAERMLRGRRRAAR